jgi:2,4-dienoyl-CoA reductase-like NADH-dependent reductase (Old Yellow Enzyme family)
MTGTTTAPDSFSALFTPWSIGSLKLKHRVVLAPLTRMRAEKESMDPTDLMVEYYKQRASDGGLIITEVSPFISQ